MGPGLRILVLRVAGPGSRVQGSRVPGSRVSGPGSRVLGLRFRVSDPRVSGPGSQTPGFRDLGPDFRLSRFKYIRAYRIHNKYLDLIISELFLTPKRFMNIFLDTDSRHRFIFRHRFD